MAKQINQIKVKASDFCVYYGSKQALKDISMDILEKQVTALIGPSGCGKSTFLRSINRMNDLIPTAKFQGKIIIDEIDVFNPSVDVVQLRRYYFSINFTGNNRISQT